MNTVMSKEKLEKLLDRAVREVTEQAVGVRLYQSKEPLGNNLCSIHILFTKGFHTGVSLCAETSLLSRMACAVLEKPCVTHQELEDVSKEYFNILCGKIAAFLFQKTKVAARFGIPSFFRGIYVPDGRQTHFVLSYVNDQGEGSQLIHYIPDNKSLTEPGNVGTV